MKFSKTNQPKQRKPRGKGKIKLPELEPDTIAEKLDILVPKCVLELSKLLDSECDSTRLQAIKLVLSKRIPDLKAVEIDGNTLPIQCVKIID